MYYGQTSETPDIFSTGTNEEGLSLTYNYDTHQLGSTGQHLSKYIPSIAKEESDLGKYIISHAKSLEEANDIIKRAVNENNKGVLSDIPIATPMFFGISEYNHNGIDKSEIVEIVISNSDDVIKTFNAAKDVGESDDDTKAAARKVMKVDYEIINNKDYVIQTNSVNASNLQKYVKDIPQPPESKSRYNALTVLLEHSNSIAENANDYDQPYSTELAHMFAKSYFVPGQKYSDAENMAVSRNHTKAYYIVSRVQSDKDDNYYDNSLSLYVELTSELQIYNRAAIQLNKDFWNKYKDGEIIISNIEPYSSKPEVKAKLNY